MFSRLSAGTWPGAGSQAPGLCPVLRAQFSPGWEMWQGDLPGWMKNKSLGSLLPAQLGKRNRITFPEMCSEPLPVNLL